MTLFHADFLLFWTLNMTARTLYSFVCLINGTAIVFPTSFATTRNRTQISSVAPPWWISFQDALLFERSRLQLASFCIVFQNLILFSFIFLRSWNCIWKSQLGISEVIPTAQGCKWSSSPSTQLDVLALVYSVVNLVTPTRSPSYLATILGKVIHFRDVHILVRKV